MGGLPFRLWTNLICVSRGTGELHGFVRLALGRGWPCPLCSVSGWAWCVGLLQCGWVAGHALAGTVGLLCARDGPAGRPYMKQGVNGRDGICLTLHGGRSRRVSRRKRWWKRLDMT